MPGQATIALDGPFEALWNGRTVPFAARGPARLLAYLALAGPSARSRVAAELWPGVDPARALASLRQALRGLALAAGEGWVVADRASLRLHGAVVVERGAGPLLEGWDEPWIARFRPAPAEAPPLDELLGLLAWYRDRSPATAVGLAADAFSLLALAPMDRYVREVAPLLGRLDRLPPGSGEPVGWLARAHYLMGDMERALATYRRIEREIPERAQGERHAQVVVLRESGLARAACRKAQEALALAPPDPLGTLHARYHLGYARYLGGEREGLGLARASVEALGDHGERPFARLFPTLNVAEGLLDSGDPAAAGFLREAAALLASTQDPLAHLTLETLQALALAADAPETALGRLLDLERRAWEARLAPYAASVADRAAAVAHRMGRTSEATRLLRRGDRVREGLGIRRAPLERARLAPLRPPG